MNTMLNPITKAKPVVIIELRPPVSSDPPDAEATSSAGGGGDHTARVGRRLSGRSVDVVALAPADVDVEREQDEEDLVDQRGRRVEGCLGEALNTARGWGRRRRARD